MTDLAPAETTTLDRRAEGTVMPWSRVRELLTAPSPADHPGGYFPSYLGTVRPDGRPHATGVGIRWYDGDLYFLSGPGTRKSRNLAANPVCTLAMRLPDGLDLVLEGEAAPIDDPAILDAVGALIRQSGWPVEPPPVASRPHSAPGAAIPRHGSSTVSSSTQRSPRAPRRHPLALCPLTAAQNLDLPSADDRVLEQRKAAQMLDFNAYLAAQHLTREAVNEALPKATVRPDHVTT